MEFIPIFIGGIILLVIIIAIIKFFTGFKRYKKDFGYFTGSVYLDTFPEDTWSKKEENCSLSNNGKMTVFSNKFDSKQKIYLGEEMGRYYGEKKIHYEMVTVTSYCDIYCIPFDSEQECKANDEKIKKYFDKSGSHQRSHDRVKNVAIITDSYKEGYSKYNDEVLTFRPGVGVFVEDDDREFVWQTNYNDISVDY